MAEAGRWFQPPGVKKPDLGSWTEAERGFLEAGIEPACQTQRSTPISKGKPGAQRAGWESCSLSHCPAAFPFTGLPSCPFSDLVPGSDRLGSHSSQMMG